MPTAELRKGEDYPAAVRRVRSEIATFSSELADVNAAGLPVFEIKEQMKRHVAERAGRGRPNVTVSQRGFEVSFTTEAWSKKIDLLDLLCFLDRDKMVEQLCKMIDELRVPQLVLPPVERCTRISAIRTKIGELERLEEALIAAAENRGSSSLGAWMLTRRPSSASPSLATRCRRTRHELLSLVFR